MVIQDDAVVCKNFIPALEHFVSLIPDAPICLFAPGLAMKTLRQLQRKRLDAASGIFLPLHRQDFMPVVGVLWPRHKAEHFLRWSDTARLPGMPNPRSDDAVAGHWARVTNQRVYVCLPSLVEHPDDVKSVVANLYTARQSKARTAFLYIGDSDPLAFDWRVPIAGCPISLLDY